ncbi:MAG: glycoside hydrolase family 88 protein [Clostridia bacterium]|nr:glycoside hydrolase family 88 protein [Clostridia bacterium]
MDLLKIAEKIAYRYMALNPPSPISYRAFYSGGVRRGSDYRYEADMNKIFPEAKIGDCSTLKCVYLADCDGSIGMDITLFGTTVLFVNGEKLFGSDIFTERNNHISNRLNIPVKKGVNEIELHFKKTALGFGCIFGTHLAKWDYIFMRPDDYNQEGCIYRLNEGAWLPENYEWDDSSLSDEEKKDILNPENVALRRLDKDDMWIRPYYGKGNFGHWNYPLGVVMYGLMRTASLLEDKKIEDYTKAHIQMTLNTFDYAMWDKAVHGGATSLHNLLTSIDSLDDCGAFCAAVEEATLLYNLDSKKICDFVADYIENHQPRNPDGSFCRQHQLHSFHNETMWLDDMYMSVPFLVRRYRLTQDEKYLSDAVNQFVQYKKWLYMEERNLMSHVYDLRHGIPTLVPWGRGNGWFIFSLTELLDVLPEEHPQRAFLEDFFKTLAKGYLVHQSPDGRWRQVIDDSEAYLETSCTAMFACSFMRGFRWGLLDDKYRASAIRAVESIAKNCVDDMGNVYGVCRGSEFSFSNDYYKYDLLPRDNDTHGIGIVLLSIYEVMI